LSINETILPYMALSIPPSNQSFSTSSFFATMY